MIDFTASHSARWRAPLLVVGALLLVGVGVYVWVGVAYANRIMPGLRLGSASLGGLPVASASTQIIQQLDDARGSAIILREGDTQRAYTLAQLGLELDDEATAQAAYQFGRSGLSSFWQRVRAITVGAQLVAQLETTPQFDQLATELAQRLTTASHNAQVTIVGQVATAQPAQPGQTLDVDAFAQQLTNQVAHLNFVPLDLPITPAPPQLTTAMAEATASTLNHYLALPYVLQSRDQEFAITAEQLWEWVRVDEANASFLTYIDRGQLTTYLADLASQINRPMHNAVWEMRDNRVTAFRADQPGVTLKVEPAVELVQAHLFTDNRTLDLPVDYVEPATKLADLNQLGLVSLVAQGSSNFRGSPNNRRHNIRIGAGRFDLVLVAPGDTFSFNRALGAVDASTGYLPELVIKGDETIPEYGGGLCQVSTTAFRAILNGGYPVVARKNHSYRVSYYEPAGTDATIYPPYPDLQFTNDSPGHILMDTWIDGDNLYFDFYGTPTGRTVQLEGPTIYNVTGYPEPVYIETSTIPAGEVRQVDSAHRGADAVLYRYVYDASGKQIASDEFRSHYIPWPAKYLVGMPEAPKVEADLENVAPPAPENPTATPETI